MRDPWQVHCDNQPRAARVEGECSQEPCHPADVLHGIAQQPQPSQGLFVDLAFAH